jgi:tetratricopeptide (TPR) repeat protein
MSKRSFRTLLTKADQCAYKGDWLGTRELLEQAEKINPQHSDVLSGLGNIWIQLGNPQTAILYFEKVVKLNPESADAYNNLGTGYILGGRFDEAAIASQKALALDPEHTLALKNLAVIYLHQEKYKEGIEILAAIVKAYPEDNEALSILAECYEQTGDIDSASFLYKRILTNIPSHTQAKEALHRIHKSNLDKTYIARPEHTKKLAALKELKPTLSTFKLDSKGGNGRNAGGLKVVFYGPPEARVETRMAPIVQALAANGQKVKVGTHFESDDLEKFDTFVFSRPHIENVLTEGLMQCVNIGKHVVVDLDEDFKNLPMSYSGYDKSGPGNPMAMGYLDKCLELASAITVPSAGLAHQFEKYFTKIKVFPHCWDSSNTMWIKPAPKKKTLNLGVIATHTHPVDLSIMGNSIYRLLQDYPDTLLVIGFGLDLYEAFAEIPEDRKSFLPMGRLDDYPFMLANFDILLFPLIEHPYNQNRSDLPLLEAGVRCIPWVATPVPAFQPWEGGGEFAKTIEEWYSAVSGLIADVSKRDKYGGEGKTLAEERDSKKAINDWENFLGKYK